MTPKGIVSNTKKTSNITISIVPALRIFFHQETQAREQETQGHEQEK